MRMGLGRKDGWKDGVMRAEAMCKAGSPAPCHATSTGYAWWGVACWGARGTGYDQWEKCVLRAWGLVK